MLLFIFFPYPVGHPEHEHCTYISVVQTTSNCRVGRDGGSEKGALLIFLKHWRGLPIRWMIPYHWYGFIHSTSLINASIQALNSCIGEWQTNKHHYLRPISVGRTLLPNCHLNPILWKGSLYQSFYLLSTLALSSPRPGRDSMAAQVI